MKRQVREFFRLRRGGLPKADYLFYIRNAEVSDLKRRLTEFYARWSQ